MKDDLISIVRGSIGINEKLVSKVRLEILWALSELGVDGATARQLKAGLNLNDGVLYSNLKKLENLGYLRCQQTTIEGKELELYSITDEGLTEWKKVRGWLRQLLGCEDDTCAIIE
jgi:DNA-binding PadR family transcriptional regulator